MSPYLYRTMLAILVCIAACAMNCVRQVAGDVTETGNAAVAGIVRTEAGQPASGAIIKVYPSDFDPVKSSSIPDSLTDTTTSNGRYFVRIGSAGSFNIVATHQLNAISLAKDISIRTDAQTAAPDIILTPGGAVSVQVPRGADTVNGYIYIRGTPWSAPLCSISNGAVTLTNVAEGAIPSVYYAPSLQASSERIAEGAQIVRNDTVSIDRINRGASCFIGIDEWEAGYSALSTNASLFSVMTSRLSGGITSGWYTKAPAGAYVTGRISQAQSLGLRPAFVIQNFPESSFDSARAMFANPVAMLAYYSQFDSLVQLIKGKNAILIFEPFTLGLYAQRAHALPLTCTPEKEFAKVKYIGLPWLAPYPDNFVGFVRACIAHVHALAPDASVGIHFMYNAVKTGTSSNGPAWYTSAEQDSLVRVWKQFTDTLGILNTIDFISVGKNGIDAGKAGEAFLWDDGKNAAYVAYANAVHTAFAKPLVGWYLPIGHRGLPNTQNRYEDSFAPYFFTHTHSFTDAGFCGMLFGKYESDGTDLSDAAGSGDDGWFIDQLKAWKVK